MLAFTSVYFFGSRLFNGLRPFGVKILTSPQLPQGVAPRRVRLVHEFGRTLRLRFLPLARLIGGNLAGLLQVRLHRRSEVLVNAEVLGEAVDLVHELLAGLVVIDLVGAGDRLVAIEPVERLEIRRDRGKVAGGDPLCRKLNRWSEAVQLQLRMLGPAIDPALPQLLRNDLPDAGRTHALFGRGLVIGEALAQLGEHAPSPEHHAMRAHPSAPHGRRVFSHPISPYATRTSGKKRYNTKSSAKHKQMLMRSTCVLKNICKINELRRKDRLSPPP